MLEIKVALIEILRKFSFARAPETVVGLEVHLCVCLLSTLPAMKN